MKIQHSNMLEYAYDRNCVNIHKITVLYGEHFVAPANVMRWSLGREQSISYYTERTYVSMGPHV